MKILTFISLIIFSINTSFAQKRDFGSAKVLAGNVYVLNIFVSEPGRPWSLSERKAILKKSEKAYIWLQQRANNRAVKLKFINENNNMDLVLPYIPNFGERNASNIIKDALKLSGFNNKKNFNKWINERHVVDSYFVAIFANKSGRSFAPFFSSDEVEGFLVYKSYQGIQELPSTIAHEALHAFGALDLYVDPMFAKNKNKKNEQATKLWPKDIMVQVPFNINEAKIDELTAWRIGLQKNKNPKYDYFEH
jgi:hypothetical protein